MHAEKSNRVLFLSPFFILCIESGKSIESDSRLFLKKDSKPSSRQAKSCVALMIFL